MPSSPVSPLIITGMHRSGTSALTRVCNLLGMEVGDRLVPARANDNETGFWEHEDLVTVNEHILEHFRGSHLDVINLPEGWYRLPEMKRYARRIGGILRRDFAKQQMWAGHECWGVKDPRISRLLPLWRDVCDHLELAPKLIISLRSPLEVARSLHVRNGISVAQGLLLWTKYNLEAERYSRGLPRAFIHYPDLLADWQTTMERVTRQLEVNWPQPMDRAALEVSAFLRPDLKHQNAGEDLREAGVPDLIVRIYETLLQATTSDEVSEAALDHLAGALAVFDAPLQESIQGCHEELRYAEEAMAEMRRHTASIENSFFWRGSKPLRWGWCQFKGIMKPERAA